MTVRLRVDERVPPPEWDALVACVGGTVFHSAAWAAYTLAEQRNAVPEFYTLHAGDDVLGVALGFRASSLRRWAALISGHRWLDALPAVRGAATDLTVQFGSLLESHARAAGDVSFLMGSFASPGSETVLRALGFRPEPRLEFELRLDRPERELWDGMDYKRRKNVKKADRFGVQVVELPPDDGIRHLRRLQAESGERIRARGGPDLGHREGSAGDPVGALLRSGVGRIVGAVVDGTCVSASLFTTFNELAYHTLSGHDATALKTQAPTLVLWEMIRRFREEGIRRLNLGGCGIGAIDRASPEHGVYSYKKAFGGQRLDCATGYKVLRPGVRRVSALLGKVLLMRPRGASPTAERAP